MWVEDAVVGEQGVDRLGIGGDHGVAQERERSAAARGAISEAWGCGT